jgi:hypothetical protein
MTMMSEKEPVRIFCDPDAIARDTRAFLYEGELGSL